MKINRSRLYSAACLILAFTAMLTFGVSSVLAQTDNSSAAEDAEAYAALTKVPEKARGRHNPLENDSDAIAAGGKLFEQHCVECHGMKAEGTKRGPSMLKPQVQQASPGAIFWILTNGVVRHGMPDWSKLPEPQRWQIVTFLRSLKAPAAPYAIALHQPAGVIEIWPWSGSRGKSHIQVSGIIKEFPRLLIMERTVVNSFVSSVKGEEKE